MHARHAWCVYAGVCLFVLVGEASCYDHEGEDGAVANGTCYSSRHRVVPAEACSSAGGSAPLHHRPNVTVLMLLAFI